MKEPGSNLVGLSFQNLLCLFLNLLIVSDDIAFSDRLFQSSITLCEKKT